MRELNRLHPIDRDSDKTDEFSAQKSCVGKRMGICDDRAVIKGSFDGFPDSFRSSEIQFSH